MDSDPITISKEGPDDITTIVLDMIGNIQFKLIILIFLSFMLVSSDVFIMRGLANFEGAVDYKQPTSWGTFLQGSLLVIISIFIDAGIKQNII
jgi:hypothetical protein